ncbi:MAG: hypothetical protein Q7U10_07605 [Thermodesulfovibrionia bacterium]|nr:hypothetical protein [Thermodesulfovibrionia bacterium]
MTNGHKLPFRIDTEALALGYYCVLDYNYKLVREFETMEDAEVFIAEANGSDVETVRNDAETQALMLHEYRQNMKRSLKERKSPSPTTECGGGWSWDSLPEEVKRQFPAPPERSAFSSIQEYEEASGFWIARVGRSIAIALQQYKKPKSGKRKWYLLPFAKIVFIWIGFFALIVYLGYFDG